MAKEMKKESKKENTRTLAKASDYALLQSPVLTEKTALIGQSGNKAVFRVPKTATKPEIISAVEKIFKVKVASVSTLNTLGKVKRSLKGEGRRASSKKAYVTLAQGQTINIIEGL